MDNIVTESVDHKLNIEIMDQSTVKKEIFVETIAPSQYDVVDDTTSDYVNKPIKEDPYILSTTKMAGRHCYIQVERCDKIWETMKLIRELQEPTTNSPLEDNKSSLEEVVKSSNAQQNPMVPYIKYQPVLSNGNKSIPNFEFSVKSTRALYQCNTCGRQYSQRKTLREHSEKVHNIIIPRMRRPPKTKVETTQKSCSFENQDEGEEEDDDEEEESNRGSTASICSSAVSLDKEERLLDSASDSQENVQPIRRRRVKVKHAAPCNYCRRVLSDRYYLKIHETLIHGVKTHFPNGSGPRYLQRRPNRTTHACNECGRYFLSTETYNNHLQNAHKADKQIGSSSSSSSSLSTSIVQHRQCLPIKPDRNDEASKSSSVRLSSKKNTHLNIAQTCEICGKVFSNVTNWKIHFIKAHGISVKNVRLTGKKTTPSNPFGLYICEYCGKKFNWKTTLYNHVVLSHLKEQIAHKVIKDAKSVKPTTPGERVNSLSNNLIKCNNCTKSYLSWRSLKIHQAKVHGIIQTQMRKMRRNEDHKPYQCDICLVRFQDEKNKKHHQIVYHGIRQNNQQNAEHRPRTRNSSKVSKPSSLQVNSARTLREKDRLNYNEDNMSAHGKLNLHETSKQQMPDVSNNNSEHVFLCILCNKEQKHIRRHFMEFHKVRNPDILISQCTPMSLLVQESQPKQQQQAMIAPESKKTQNEKEEETKKRNQNQNNRKQQQQQQQQQQQSIINQEEDIINMQRKKRRSADSMKTVRRLRVPGPREAFELRAKKTKSGRRRFYCCKVCEFMSLSYDATRKHVRIGHSQEQVEEKLKSAASSVLPIHLTERQRRSDSSPLIRKRRRVSTVNTEETKQRRLSATVSDELRLTRAVKRLREESEHKCQNCGRVFRNGDILVSHKNACLARGPSNDAVIESNDTRESSDRDSGIGISITIKKKNDSYEIVSRDSSGERPRVGGDQYSDTSSDTRNSMGFSNDHQQIRQLEKKGEEEEKNDKNEKKINDDIIEPDQGAEVNASQVPSLTKLCNSVLEHVKKVGKNKERRRRKRNWSSVKSKYTCNIQTKSRVESLKSLCVKTLIANGDVEAAKRIWYPCHVCKSTWSTHKSRVIHSNVHSRK